MLPIISAIDQMKPACRRYTLRPNAKAMPLIHIAGGVTETKRGPMAYFRAIRASHGDTPWGLDSIRCRVRQGVRGVTIVAAFAKEFEE